MSTFGVMLFENVTLPNGKRIDAYRLLYGKARLGLRSIIDGAYSDVWDFDDAETLHRSITEWFERGGEGEPNGWSRHPATGRRRPGGDATGEYVNR